MKTIKKVLCLFMFSFLFIQLLSGCYKLIPYHALMYGNVYENRHYFNDEFYENNLTEGSWSEKEDSYVSGENYPKERTVIINNENDFNVTFKDFPVDVDFDKSIIVLHCFTTSSGSKYKIKSIKKDNETIVIKYKTIREKFPIPNASMPITKWVIVVMDKINFETVQFDFSK